MTTIYFDLETGGVMPHHPNIQLAAIAVNDDTGVELGSFEQKIKFEESDADPEALKLNHYDRDAWRDAINPLAAAQRFNRFIEPHKCIPMVSKRTGNSYNVAKLAGYSAVTFDLPRLKQMYGENFFPCSYHVRDVLQRVIWWFDEHGDVKRPDSLKLSIICPFFGIEVDGAHDALVDVRLAAALARKLRDA